MARDPVVTCQLCKGTGRRFHWKETPGAVYSTIYCDCPQGDLERAADLIKETRA